MADPKFLHTGAANAKAAGGKLTLTSIVIGDRARTELGDITSLAASIARVGLLAPVVVNTRYELIAGRRRLAAVTSLGWNDVPIRIVDTFDDALLALIAERDENTCRKEMSPVEMVNLGRKIEAFEQPQAKERKEASQAKKGEQIGRKPATAVGGGNFPPPSAKGKTRDKVAAAVGVSGKTYEKAKKVMEAAEKEPEKFAPVVAKMEATGKVEPAYRQVVDVAKIVVPKQLVDEDLTGPARAKLIKALDKVGEGIGRVREIVKGLQGAKIDPQTLPNVFLMISQIFGLVSAEFRELADTPTEDLSVEVLSRTQRALSVIVNKDVDPQNAKRNAIAATQLLQKILASR